MYILIYIYSKFNNKFMNFCELCQCYILFKSAFTLVRSLNIKINSLGFENFFCNNMSYVKKIGGVKFQH